MIWTPEEKKYAFQLSEEGFYMGLVERQPSPLEPGVWLMPHLAIEGPPPPNVPAECVTGKFIHWNGKEWKLIDPPEIIEGKLIYWENEQFVYRDPPTEPNSETKPG